VARIERAIEAAEALSLHAEAASGLHILSWLRQQSNDIERARTATLDAERMTRKADAATRCQQQANTARCLLEVEADMPRARALLAEADALARSLDLELIELLWGHGLLARADGDLGGASASVGRAVALARLREDHWREYECLVWLATLAFERGRLDEVAACADDIGQVAKRMGDERAPFAQTLRALVHLHLDRPQAQIDLALGLDGLRAMDDKAHLAYGLNEAAALALGQRRTDAAQAYAQEALDAAKTVRRSTETLVAAGRLVEAAVAAGDVARTDQAFANLQALAAEGLPTARAAAALERAELARSAISTPVPTPRR
jgi:hypothetical protein